MTSRALTILLSAPLLVAISSCSDNSADRDGDGEISRSERAAEMAQDAFIPMKAGRWETKFTFDKIDVPTLGKSQKKQIMAEVAKGASTTTCLSEAEAKNPGADFFGGRGTDKCVYTNFDVSGQNARMALTCTMDGMGSVDMKMKGAMGESQFDFDTDVAMRLPLAGKIKMNGKATGRYVGECANGK